MTIDVLLLTEFNKLEDVKNIISIHWEPSESIDQHQEEQQKKSFSVSLRQNLLSVMIHGGVIFDSLPNSRPNLRVSESKRSKRQKVLNSQYDERVSATRDG
jgi:hypothetical protein